jgi:YbbR domain-containing protein
MKFDFVKKVDTRVLLVSLLLAFMLWAWVTLDRQYSFTVGMPILIENMPEDRILAHKIPDSVNVVLEGSGRNFLRLVFRKPKYRLDLSSVGPNTVIDLYRRSEGIDIPGDLNLSKVEILAPRSILVDYTKKSEKELPVRPDIRFSVEPGFVWVGTTIQPEVANLSGAESYVQKKQELLTETLDYMKPLRRPLELRLKVMLPEDENVAVNPAFVKVRVDIQKLAENNYPQLPVEVVNTPVNKVVSPIPPYINVTLKGGDKILAGVSNDQIRAYINYATDFDPQTGSFWVNFDLPPNVTVVSYEPKYFEFQEEIKDND